MARSFDGSTSEITAASAADLALAAGGFTVAFWAFITNTGAIPVSKGNGGTDNEYFFFVDGAGKVKFGGINTGGSEQNSGLSTTDIRGAWRQVTGLYDGTSFRIFVDGTPENAQASSGTLKSNLAGGLNIGAQNTTPHQNHTAGRLAEVTIWNRALATAEVAMLGKGFSPLCLPSSRVFYAPLVRSVSDYHGHALTDSNTTAGDHARVFMPSRSLQPEVRRAGRIHEAFVLPALTPGFVS